MKIEIQGCRWFQKSYGNTYHGVKCFVDGELVFKSEDYEYGYDDQYITTGLRELMKLDILTKEEVENSPRWELRENYGLECSVVDVDRQKDLKDWMR